MDTWQAIVFAIGGFVSFCALAAILWRVMKVAVRVDAALPTLLGIAAEFSPNSGHSLRDQIDGIRSEQLRVADELVVGNQRVQDIATNLDKSTEQMNQHIKLTAKRFQRIERKLDA